MQSSEFDYKTYINLINKRKRMFVLVALAIMTVSVIICYLIPKKYEAKSTVFIEKNVIGELVKGLAVMPSMEDSLKVLTYAMKSRTMLLKVVNEMDMNVNKKSDAAVEALIKKLQNNTDIKLKDNNLFIISFKDENPRVARDYVNTLVGRYIEDYVSSKRDESYGATQFLSEQIKVYKEKMEKAEKAVNSFKSERGNILSLDEGRQLQDINSAKQKLYDLQLRRRQLEGLKNVAKKNDPLQIKLSSLEKRLQELRVEYTDSYPDVIKVKADIDTLKEQLRRNGGAVKIDDPQELEKIDSELSAIRLSESSLNRYIATNQSMLQSIPSSKAEVEKLEMEMNTQKKLYDQLLGRHGQMEVSKQMEVQDKTTTFRVVDPAVIPSKPVSPDRIKIILMGIIAGLAGALGLLILLDYLDQSIKSVNSLKTLGTPVLAVIPLIKSDDEIQSDKRKDLRLYCVSGFYFTIIFAVLMMEVMGLTFMDDLAAKLQLAAHAKDFISYFK